MTYYVAELRFCGFDGLTITNLTSLCKHVESMLDTQSVIVSSRRVFNGDTTTIQVVIRSAIGENELDIIEEFLNRMRPDLNFEVITEDELESGEQS